ncbi:hypothetical protein D3C71_659940 [compost metagenome]
MTAMTCCTRASRYTVWLSVIQTCALSPCGAMRCTVHSVRAWISAAVAAQPGGLAGASGVKRGGGGSAGLLARMLAMLVDRVRPTITLLPRSRPAVKATPGE